jgi:UDP-glucose-4-epimerase GalE
MRTALVTGGAGYLGSHLAKALKKAGYTTVCFDIKSPRNMVYWNDAFIGDVRESTLERPFNQYKIDVVFHLAGRIEVGESVEHPELFWDVNVGGTTNLLNIMKEHNVRNIVYSSTAGLYRSTGTDLSEKDQIADNNPYANSKYAAECAIRNSTMNHIIFRFFNLAGADPDGEMGETHNPETHLIPVMFENLNNFVINGSDYRTPDGTCIRDYVHVSDVADAHLHGAYYLKRGGESKILNLGTGKGHSILEIIKIIESVTGKKVNYSFLPRRDGDPESLIADSTLAKKILTFNPNFDIVDIIQTAYHWHKKNDKI